jgi:hypothetical protein
VTWAVGTVTQWKEQPLTTPTPASTVRCVPEINSTYLMLVATSTGLAYILRERKMAFPPTREVRLEVGDRLLLYTTRSVFRNPTLDRGRVIGTAEAASPILPLEKQLFIAGREYTTGCDLKLTGLAALGEGVILADIAEELMVFQPNPGAWSIRMRRSVLQLPYGDVDLIMAKLKPALHHPDETLNAYLERAARVGSSRGKHFSSNSRIGHLEFGATMPLEK